MSLKVDLDLAPPRHGFKPGGGQYFTSRVLRSWPYYCVAQTGRCHRVRSANMGRKHRHIGVTFWCGNTGLLSPDRGNHLVELPHSEESVCERCIERLERVAEAGGRLYAISAAQEAAISIWRSLSRLS